MAAKKSTFIWYELLTTAQDAALDFYKAVAGWSAADQTLADMGDFRYTIVSAGEQGIGGVMQLNQAMLDGGARPGWIGYIGVADTDAAAAAVSSSGGTVLMPPDDIPNVGRFALLADPAGAPFYVMTPTPRADGGAGPETAALGHIGWHELYSGSGQEAAFAFYAAHFGWETLDTLDMGSMGKYRIFGVDGKQVGGMMDKPADMPVSAWSYYINVDGIDAAVERITTRGGRVLMGPHEVPGGSWIVQAIDPQGASFALVSRRR